MDAARRPIPIHTMAATTVIPITDLESASTMARVSSGDVGSTAVADFTVAAGSTVVAVSAGK